MHVKRLRTLGISLAAVAVALSAHPALARRTVVDNSYSMTLTGYCSPGAAALEGCPSQSLPFSIAIDGQTFNSYYVNSNGTLSLGSIEAELAAQSTYTDLNDPNFPPVYTGPDPFTSLSSYSVPIFSPNFVDGPGFASDFLAPFEFDGEFVATYSTTPDSLYVEWYSCDSPLACGTQTVDSLTNVVGDSSLEDWIGGLGFDALGCPCDVYPTDEAIRAAGVEALLQILDLPVYAMTLTQLDSGFQVDFTYHAGGVATYGFNLPTAFFEETGPLANRTFLFDSNGQLIREVPEPATWLMTLLGFGAAGFSLRRRSNRRLVAQ